MEKQTQIGSTEKNSNQIDTLKTEITERQNVTVNRYPDILLDNVLSFKQHAEFERKTNKCLFFYLPTEKVFVHKAACNSFLKKYAISYSLFSSNTWMNRV